MDELEAAAAVLAVDNNSEDGDAAAAADPSRTSATANIIDEQGEPILVPPPFARSGSVWRTGISGDHSHTSRSHF